MKVEFATPFQDKYQRNNKQTGKKNIRCFPTCNPTGHVGSGFCGRPVKIVLHDCPVPVGKLRAWAQFETVGMMDMVQQGETILETEATTRERCRQYPMLPWMRGNIYSGIVDFDDNGFEVLNAVPKSSSTPNQVDVTIVINSERMGWHYQWVSNKHTCDNFHVMKMYLFVVQNDGVSIKCIGSFPSSQFQIYCRRRTKKQTPRLVTPSVITVPNAAAFSDYNSSYKPMHNGNGMLPPPPTTIYGSSSLPSSDEVQRDTKMGQRHGSSSDSLLLIPDISDMNQEVKMLNQSLQTNRVGPSSSNVLKRRPSWLETSNYHSANQVAMPPTKAGRLTGPARRRDSESSQSPHHHVLLSLMEMVCFRMTGGGGSDQAGTGSSSSIEDFSSNLLGNILCGFDFDTMVPERDPNQQGQPDQPETKSLGTELANYLMEESSFTHAISSFFQHNALAPQDEQSLTRLFKEFTEVVQRHVEGYVEKKGMTMKQFMEQLDMESRSLSESRTKQENSFKFDLQGIDPNKRFNSFKIAFLRRLRAETTPSSMALAESPPVHPDFDINGLWLNSGESSSDFERAQRELSDLGYPVFLFKVIRIMLWQLRITITRDYCVLQGEKKLMHNAEFIFRVDNSDHPFEIPHVVPLGIPSIPCMYRAYCTHENGTPLFRCIIHGFFPRLHGVRFEITRTVYILDNKQTLEVIANFDIIRSTGHRDTLTCFRQKYFKCLGESDYKELLDFTQDLFADELENTNPNQN